MILFSKLFNEVSVWKSIIVLLKLLMSYFPPFCSHKNNLLFFFKKLDGVLIYF